MASNEENDKQVRELLVLFELMDLDSNGFVDKDEFAQWASDEGIKDIDSVFQKIDISKNDRISPEELIKYFLSYKPKELEQVAKGLYRKHSAKLARIRANEGKDEEDISFSQLDTHVRAEKSKDLSVKPSQQKEIIKKIMGAHSKLREGETWYVLSFKWWQMWDAFVHFRRDGEESSDNRQDEMEELGSPPKLGRSLSFEHGQEPNAIDNSDIAGEQPGELKLNIADEYDFVLIPEEAWTQLSEWYGGGPAFPRKVISFGMTKELRVDLHPFFFTVVWAHSVTGKPNPKTVTRKHMSRSKTIGDLVHFLREEGKVDVGVPADVGCRMWVKKVKDSSGKWEVVPEGAFGLALEESQIVSGDTLLMEAKNELLSWPRGEEESEKPPKKNFRDFEVGDQIDASDTTNKWYQSVVRDVKEKKIFVHYEGWSATWDEWIDKDSNRLAPFKSKAKDKYVSKDEVSSMKWAKDNAEKGSPPVAGAVGLRNLGNTCFMNSTLQCLSHTKVLSDYFTSDEFAKDVNKDNPLGHMGRVANDYADLVKDLWSNKYVVVAPAQFKHTIGQFAPRFSGFQQQDSSEFMSFLLDGLHEDLNRVKKKPYTQDVESKGRSDAVVAKESWDTYRLRNDSVVVDLLTGQLKSTIVCPESKCGKISIKFDPYIFLSVPLPVVTTRLVIVTVVYDDPAKEATVFGVTVDKRGYIIELKNALSELCGVQTNSMIVGDITQHRVVRTLGDKSSISDIRDRDTIYVFECPVIAPKKSEIPKDDSWKALTVGDIIDAQDTDQNWYEADILDEKDDKWFIHYCGWTAKWNEWHAKDSKRVAPKNKNSDPQIWKIFCHHTSGRDDESKGHNECFGFPFVLSIQSNTVTYSELKDMVVKQLQHTVSKEGGGDNKSAELPFTIGIVDSNQKHTLLSSEFLEKNGKTFVQLSNKGSNITINWSDLTRYDKNRAESVGRHKTAPAPVDNEQAPSDQKSLSDCLKEFAKQEILSVEDAWYCADCKEFRQASKKFDLWSIPEVLVIHLKRFGFNKLWREKLDIPIDYPLEGLDMSEFLVGPNPKGRKPIYDLYAVSVHMGGLHGGHYTAYAKNPLDGKWYNCDDSHVSETSAKSVKTRNAYMLFYCLRQAK